VASVVLLVQPWRLTSTFFIQSITTVFRINISDNCLSLPHEFYDILDDVVYFLSVLPVIRIVCFGLYSLEMVFLSFFAFFLFLCVLTVQLLY